MYGMREEHCDKIDSSSPSPYPDIIKRVLKDIPCAGVGQTVVIVPFADKLKAYLFGQQKLILL